MSRTSRNVSADWKDHLDHMQTDLDTQKRQKQRDNILAEILSTEKRYVDKLNALNNVKFLSLSFGWFFLKKQIWKN